MWSPLAFRPFPVTIISTLVYATIFITLLVVHHTIPTAPANPVRYAGINITEAWLDLQHLTDGAHPYNSRRSDVVRNWLLQRLDEILIANKASYNVKSGRDYDFEAPVTIINDLESNLTSSSGRASTYFEGTNIIVYIRGSEDGLDGWKTGAASGVLVNAHYDSISTSYGATDDGIGVITVLQLVKYFTYPGHQPRRGLVALLNNGEEDFLNGARAFARHPLSSFTHTFLNLEGAGADGKALMFRSTDAEVTRFYKGTSAPIGTVLVADVFNSGAIRSETDYVVFDGDLGMRGLDIAFFAPRARYHTDQDDARHTSRDSLWHMLSSSLHVLQGLTSDTSSTFDGDSRGKGKVPSGSGSKAVWFDLLGQVFVLFELHTMFAIAVTLLVVAPITIFAIMILLAKADRLYVFSLSTRVGKALGNLRVSTGGIRGLFRFPVILAFASAGVVGLALLLVKVNPFIIHSSPYSVWAMMLSAWIVVAWFLARALDAIRPSAFHRGYAILWLFLINWALLVIETVYEERLGIAAGYFILFNLAAAFLATLISMLEQFGLEKKEEYAEKHSQAGSEEALYHEEEANGDSQPTAAEGATETTSLLKNSKKTTSAKRPSSSRSQEPGDDDESFDDDSSAYPNVYKHEQLWSERLPSWTWVLQLLLLVPIPVILLGQIGLLLISAGNQTIADGNSPLPIYIALSIMTILIMIPIGPFLHRFTYHLPLFLVLVLLGTTAYNAFAFPFSNNNRLKVFFIQRVDLDSGINKVSLMSPKKHFLNQVVGSLPSASGQKIEYINSATRKDLLEAIWSGIPPEVVPNVHPGVPPLVGFQDWVDFSIRRRANRTSATIVLSGKNTRACRILFKDPISNFNVVGSDYDSRLPALPEDGADEIRLWSREWEKPWTVTFDWKNQPGMDGRVVCLWNDEEGKRLVPALEEVRRFAPDWMTVSKASDGLVEGYKAFAI